uniref:Sterile alpha motif domain containing 8 n=1 Tax=Eptatretus burgeri TaxID=7764 RepID=A0A8C4NCF9_EPTBU
MLTESDLRSPPLSIQVLGDIKHLAKEIANLHRKQRYRTGCPRTYPAFCSDESSENENDGLSSGDIKRKKNKLYYSSVPSTMSPKNGRTLDPEKWKTVIAVLYVLIVCGVTSGVMVVVHDSVPDMQTHPPLPDIFLDNVPLIPWAFATAEVCGLVLALIWGVVLIFHKHRTPRTWCTPILSIQLHLPHSTILRRSHQESQLSRQEPRGTPKPEQIRRRTRETTWRMNAPSSMWIVLRRMCALAGTVFLLRCVCMFVTSLSVPGTHLKCSAKLYHGGWTKLRRALEIWIGFGMTLTGVHTCGDYMFSGHTALLTLLNFFITEYTPRSWVWLHTASWVLNLFGVFFVLAAHEHYSIDVVLAFYISTRLFLYYHTLAASGVGKLRGEGASHSRVGRVRVWFPLFWFFERNVSSHVPNHFEWPFTKAPPRVLRQAFHTLSN